MMTESTQFVSTLSESTTTGPSPTSAKSRDNQPMYPVTVKRVVEAKPSTDTNFLIDGVDVYNVKLVGMVFQIVERKTDVSFVIDDGTGRISCTKWTNDAQDYSEVELLKDESYVRVHGHLKTFQSKKQLVVYAIRPVTNYNEITTHFLECIHAHCSNTRFQNGSTPAPTNPATSNFFGNNAATPSQTPAVTSSQPSQEYNSDGLGSIDKKVLDYLQQNASRAEGIHVNEIAQHLKVPLEKIMEAKQVLLSECFAYETIDEYTFKALD